MRVAISGSSGLIGTALRESLNADGHEVLRLVRRPAAAPDELQWDPKVGDIDPIPLEGLDAVVNLSGSGAGEQRWTKTYKEAMRNSRIRSTSILAKAISQLDAPPRVFVSSSGINYYGIDRGSLVLDEDAGLGEGFLAELCRDWEAAAQTIRSSDVAVCTTRFAVVMDRRGGALARMLPVFRFGVGGTLAGGQQYWSFVSLADAVRALRFLIETPGCVGAYNVSAPEPVTNAEFTRVLAHTLRRPALLPVPRVALDLVLGQFTESIAGSLRVVPARLTEAGFRFDHADARTVIDAALNRRRG